MRLVAKDQVHISSISRDTILPGQAFECSDFAGEELLKKHPGLFERAADEGKPANLPVSGDGQGGGAGGQSGKEKPDYSKFKNVGALKDHAAERHVDISACKNRGEIEAALVAADEAAAAAAENVTG